MPVEPVSLREITSIQGNANNVYGSTPGGTDVKLPFGQSIYFLNQAARLKAESDQFKYLQFQENLKNFYNRFDDIKVDGIMEVDYPDITREYATLSREIADNYDVIRNPTIDQEKYAELREREAMLRGNISRSKQDVAWRDAHKQFMTANPTFNTPENQKAFDQFNNAPVGSREYQRLSTPFVYNPTARAKAAMDVAQEKLKTEQVSGRYIDTTESETYLQDEYLRAWDALGAAQDSSGRVMNESAADSYRKLGLLPDPSQFQTVDRQIALDLLFQNKTTTTKREDPVSAQEDEQKFQAGQQAKRLAAQVQIAKIKDDDDAIEAAGRDYNEALASAFTNGYIRPDVLQSIFGDNTEVEVTDEEMETDQFGIKVKTGKKTTVKRPKIAAIGSRLENGQLVVSLYDNETKQALPDVAMSYEQAREAMKNLQGAKNAGRVADAAETYRQARGLTRNAPVLSELQPHFKLNQSGAGKLIYDPATGRYVTAQAAPK